MGIYEEELRESPKTIEPFRFKQFSAAHSRSSLKIGVDGVLIGAWGTAVGKMGIDIGCGCGLIALMAAQRNPDAQIKGVDIDMPSIEEAGENFKASRWSGRLSAELADVIDESWLSDNNESYDFIISNPPFFNAGLKQLRTSREKARHEGRLSPKTLLDVAERILRPGGTLSMIMPAESLNDVTVSRRMKIHNICLVSDRQGKAPKRAMGIFYKDKDTEEIRIDRLYIHEEDGSYSESYRKLTSPYYLKM